MLPKVIQKGSLVLYKVRPAIVTEIGEKITIQLDVNKAKRVREKDIKLIHPGPFNDLKSLKAIEVDVTEAWELLDGEETDLSELCELLFDDFLPHLAWATWLLVGEGIYFEGKPEKIIPRTPSKIKASLLEIEQKKAEQQAHLSFLNNIKSASLTDEDRKKLVEVERLALDQSDKSQILKSLDLKQTRASAHAFLIKCGYWSSTFNPYPKRFKIDCSEPHFEVPELPVEQRLDLCHLDAFAIDDAQSNDPDDAISFNDGIFWVHIADVAALVPHNSVIDQEARSRAANLYLPEMIIPMLPKAITEQLGLGLQDRSPALSIGFKVSETGILDAIEIAPSWIQVTRLTYEQAEQQLSSTFSDIMGICRLFRNKRLENEACELDLPEVSVRVNDEQVIIRTLEPLMSRQMVSEAMLMGGHAIADFCQQNNIPIPYAMQPAPSEISHPDSLAGMYAYRRLFKASKITLEPEKHFGLGLDSYTRVTSPLRRYLDLVVHQQLRLYLAGQELLTFDELSEKILSVSQQTATIRKTERFSNQHWKMIYLQQNSSWKGDAVIVDMDERKATILIPSLAMESKLRRNESFCLDESIQIQLNSVDLPDQIASFQRI